MGSWQTWQAWWKGRSGATLPLPDAPTASPAPTPPPPPGPTRDDPPPNVALAVATSLLDSDPLGPRATPERAARVLQPGAFRVARLDPPLLLSRLAVYVVQMHFFQYRTVNAVVLTRAADEAYVLLPPGGLSLGALPGWRVRPSAPHCLPLARWHAGDAADVNPELARRLEHDARACSAPVAVDLAGELNADLRRAVALGDATQRAAVIDLLDRLACHTGHGRDQLAPRKVLVGDEARARFQAGVLTRSPRPPMTAAVRLSASAATHGGPYRSARGADLRLAALVEVHQRFDGSSGWRDETAVGELVIDDAGWHYEREVLWVDEEEGDCYS